jgi:CRISPR/Cas system-associated exonuclease Cas4 (RecB family)
MTNIEITVDELHSYLQCPAKYNFKHQKGLAGEESRSILFKKAIHKTIDYFFFSVMNGQMPTLPHLKDKWEMTYVAYLGDIDRADILTTSKGHSGKSTNPRKTPDFIKGLEMLYSFYTFNKDNPGVPIAVDHEYRVAFGDVIVRGKFELIREILDPATRSRYVEIVDFKTSDKTPEYMLIKHDINLLLASYAFRELFNAKEDRMKYHYLPTGRDIIVKKTDDDFKRIESIVKGIAYGIKEEYFYPRQTFMCRSCELKEICDVAEF